MKLKEIREKIIKGFIAKELLEDSVYPSLELICSILLRDYQGLDVGSTLLNDRHLVHEGEPASISKFEEIQKYVDIDIRTLYSFVDYVEDYLNISTRSALSKINALVRKSKTLEGRAKALLLKNADEFQDTEIIEVPFNTAELIDLAKSDADIDFGNQYVTSKTRSGLALHSLSNDVDEILVTPLSRGYLSFKSPSGRDESNIISDNSTPWIHNVVMSPSYHGSVSLSVKLKLNKNKDISRLFFGFQDTSSYYVSISAAIDGEFRTISDEALYTGYADISFQPVNVSYIVLTIKNSQHHSVVSNPNGRLFRFSINELRAGLHEYADRSTLQTTQIIPQGKFSQMSLSVDWDIPESTDIKMYGSIDGVNFSELVPLESRKIDLPKSLSVTDTFSLIQHDKAVDFTKAHPYIAGQNIATTCKYASLIDVSKIDPKILRNLGGFKIESEENSLVSCVLYVNADNIEFDFETYPAHFDGTFKTSKQTLTKGFHTIKFNKGSGVNGYKAYLDSLVASTFNYGSHLASECDTSLFVNVTDDKNYEKFSFVEIDSEYVAVIKMLQANVVTDHSPEAEQMLLVEKDFNTADLKSSLYIKAVFISDNYQAPKLNAFKIKVV